MSILQTIKVNDFDVKIIKIPFDKIQNNLEKFNGQKILHPFQTEKTEIVQYKNGKSYPKKIVKMNYNDSIYLRLCRICF
jgi:hypothetical protein